MSRTKYLQVLGASFLLFTGLLILIGFLNGDLTCSQQRQLHQLWPICAGIAAAAFTGTLELNGRVGPIALAAGGGAAVWFLTFYLSGPVPCTSAALMIRGPQLFDESFVQTDATGKSFLTELRPKLGNTYKLQKAENKAKSADMLVIPIGFTVLNANVEEDNSINIRLVITGLKHNNTAAWRDQRDYVHRDSWKNGSMALRFGEQAILSMLNVKDSTTIPFPLYIGCRTEKDIQDWSGDIEIQVQDNSRADPQGMARKTYTLDIDKKAFDLLPSTEGTVGCPKSPPADASAPDKSRI
jgi:hypothetical protein